MGSYSSCLYILLFFTRNSYWNRSKYWYNSNIFLMATYCPNKNWKKTPIQSTICTILPYNSPFLVPPESSNSVLHRQRKHWKPKINESCAFKLFLQSCWWTYPHRLTQTHLGSVTCIFRTAEVEVQFVTVLGAKLTLPHGDWTQNQGLFPTVPEPWRQPVPN